MSQTIVLLQILQTGQEINELDQSGFNTLGPTIYAGNLGSNKYIIQVSTCNVIVHVRHLYVKDYYLSQFSNANIKSQVFWYLMSLLYVYLTLNEFCLANLMCQINVVVAAGVNK